MKKLKQLKKRMRKIPKNQINNRGEGKLTVDIYKTVTIEQFKEYFFP